MGDTPANAESHEDLDPVVVGIGLEWLTQYARFLRRSPELLDRLVDDDAGRFEMVPVPRLLLDRLAVPGIVGSGSLGDSDPDLSRIVGADVPELLQWLQLRAAPSRAAPFQRIHEFAALVQAGDLAGIDALMAPAFVNPDGQGREDLRRTLADLSLRTRARKLEVLEIQEVAGAEHALVAHAKARWTAAAELDAASVDEVFSLEVVLEQEPEGEWRISGLRSL